MACQSTDTSLNEFTDEDFSFLDMELEALQSIFINELEVKEHEKFTTVSIDLYPSTADKLDEQYVRMTLEFVLSEEYPEEIPEIKIRNPRGLSDEELKSIYEDLSMIAESKRGNSMLFEMIDAAKEHLTVGNRPSEECAICLHGFSDNDVFTKTECYHYFHSHCLARYAKNFFENIKNCEDDVENKSKNDELLCPMCRIPIQFDEWDLDYPPPEECDENSFTLSEEMIELQKKMSVLFEKQVKKGGIIDVEAEKNKYLLEISNVPTKLSNEEMAEQMPAAEGGSAVETKHKQSDEVDNPTCDRKDYVNDHREHSRRTDYRPRNRNFNRPNESRSNNRYNHRYNKQSFNRGNYNRYRYGKQNLENSTQNEPEALENQDSSVLNITKNDDLINNTPDVVEHDDVHETSDYPLPNSKVKYNPNFSPRYKNRGYHHGRNNYNTDNSRQSSKYGYNERRGSQTSHRYSVQRAEDSSNKYDKRVESDFSTQDDNDGKTSYKSGNYKQDSDYYAKQRYSDSRNGSYEYSGNQRYGDNRNNFHEHYTKQRYSDNRNNSYHGFKGAYGGRDGYSNSYNSRSNKFTESKDRDQYQERNYKEKRTYRDMKYKANDDTGYNRSRQGTRNYSGSRSEKYSDRSFVEPSNNETKSLELNNQNGDHDDTLLSENGSLSKSNFHHESPQVEKSLDKNDLENIEEKSPNTASSLSSSTSTILPNAFGENPDVILRTVKPPPGFANPLKKVVYGLQGANPPPGFNRS